MSATQEREAPAEATTGTRTALDEHRNGNNVIERNDDHRHTRNRARPEHHEMLTAAPPLKGTGPRWGNQDPGSHRTEGPPPHRTTSLCV